MRNFFIFGLPRSRTAWLANLLTYDGAICLHEAMPSFRTITYLRAAFERMSERYDYIGMSDTAASIFGGQIAELFPGAPMVVVERPMADSLEAVTEAFGVGVELERFADALDDIKRRFDPLVIQYDSMRMSDFRAIWEHCVPGRPFDENRASMLDRLLVEEHHEKFVNYIAANLSNIRVLLGG